MKSARLHLRTAFFLIVFCASISSIYAYATTTEVIEEPDKATVTLALENADIRELIQWATKFTDKTLLVDKSVQGSITVLAGPPMTRDQAFEAFLVILEANGYQVEDKGSLLRITGQKQDNSPVVDNQELGIKKASQRVARIISLNSINGATATTAIKPFLSKDAFTSVLPASNALLVVDEPELVERAISFVRQIDKTTLHAVVPVPIQFGSASKILDSMLKIQPKMFGEDSENKLTAVADPTTNQILLAGPKSLVDFGIGIIDELDKPLPTNGEFKVVHINYANASKLAANLRNTVRSLSSSGSTDGTTKESVSIDVNTEHNALIINAPPEIFRSLQALIAELDVRRPQVLVEAVIVEVNNDVARDLGVEWRSSVPKEGVFSGTSAMTSNLTTPTPPALGSGLTLGFYSSDELRSLIRVLESDASSNILSTPTIVALDNEDAEILVGENVPFVTGSSTSSASPTDNPFTTIERHDIGITLRVKPQVNHNRSITLNIEQTAESITTSPVPTADIVTSKRSIKTRVLIENNQVLVLGGLIRDEVVETEKRVPVLSRIPGLGWLFKSKNKQVVKKNLMVFIHPTILDSAQSSSQESDRRYNRMLDLQKSFGTGKSKSDSKGTPLLEHLEINKNNSSP